MASLKEEKKSVKQGVRNLLDSVFAVLFFVLTPFCPFLCYISSILSAKVLLKSRNPLYFLFTLLLSLVCSFLFIGHIYLILTYFILTFSFAIILSIFLSMGMSFHSTTFVTAAGSSAITFAFFILLIYVIGGSLTFRGLENLFGDLWRSFAGALREYPALLAETHPENISIYQTAVENIISHIKAMMPYAPSMVFGASFVFAAAGIVYLKAAVKSLDLKKIGRFSGFKPERISGILALVSFIAGMLIEDEGLLISVNSMNYIFLGYFTVACFSYISFIMTCRGLSPARRTNVYAIAISVTALFPLAAYIAGMIEAIAQSRNKLEAAIKRITESGDSPDILELLEQLRQKEEEIKKSNEESELKWYEREAYRKMYEEEPDDPDPADGSSNNDEINKNGGN